MDFDTYKLFKNDVSNIEEIFDSIKTNFTLPYYIINIILEEVFDSLSGMKTYTNYEIELFEKYGFYHDILIEYCNTIYKEDYNYLYNKYTELMTLTEYKIYLKYKEDALKTRD